MFRRAIRTMPKRLKWVHVLRCVICSNMRATALGHVPRKCLANLDPLVPLDRLANPVNRESRVHQDLLDLLGSQVSRDSQVNPESQESQAKMARMVRMARTAKMESQALPVKRHRDASTGGVPRH